MITPEFIAEWDAVIDAARAAGDVPAWLAEVAPCHACHNSGEPCGYCGGLGCRHCEGVGYGDEQAEPLPTIASVEALRPVVWLVNDTYSYFQRNRKGRKAHASRAPYTRLCGLPVRRDAELKQVPAPETGEHPADWYCPKCLRLSK